MIVGNPHLVRRYTGSSKELEIQGKPGATALEALAEQFPGEEPHLIVEHRIFCSHGNQFVNDGAIADLAGQVIPLCPADRIMVIPGSTGDTAKQVDYRS